jgi:hypothetical protein
MFIENCFVLGLLMGLFASRVARFFLTQFTKRGKNTKLPLNYQMAKKCIKCGNTYISNGHRIYQPFPFQRPSIFYPNWDFCFEKYHLATLSRNCASFSTAGSGFGFQLLWMGVSMAFVGALPHGDLKKWLHYQVPVLPKVTNICNYIYL